MRRKIVVLVAGALLTLSAGVPALAQQYPNVANLKAYSAEANFMSLPGYLRWLVFQQTGQWISYAEADRVVRQQAGR
jgi:hypothetical protein